MFLHSIENDSPIDVRREIRIAQTKITAQGSSFEQRRRKTASHIGGCML
jgi:hypothetical protein